MIFHFVEPVLNLSYQRSAYQPLVGGILKMRRTNCVQVSKQCQCVNRYMFQWLDGMARNAFTRLMYSEIFITIPTHVLLAL